MANVFVTQIDQLQRIEKVAKSMITHGVDPEAVQAIFSQASRYEGLADLMELWYHESDPLEKEITLKCLLAEVRRI